MPKLVRITPMLSVNNIEDSIHFYEHYLGFKASIQTRDYAYLSKDCANIRLEKNTGNQASGVCCVIDTENIDALYQSLKSQLDQLPEGRVSAPADQAYGMRDFYIIDPDNTKIYFSEPIPKFDTDAWIKANT